MEGERTFMKNKKLLAKLIFVAILLLIIWYTFKDSAEDIVEQLGKTSLTVLVAIMAATVIYHLFEAWISQPTFHLYLQVPYSTLSRYGLGSISDHKADHTLPRTTRKRFQFLVRETKLF